MNTITIVRYVQRAANPNYPQIDECKRSIRYRVSGYYQAYDHSNCKETATLIVNGVQLCRLHARERIERLMDELMEEQVEDKRTA